MPKRGLHMTLDQLPSHLREQVARQLAPKMPRMPAKTMTTLATTTIAPTAPDKVGRKPAMPKKPNPTEQRYNADFLGGHGMFEAVNLRLDSGARYTPDWMTTDATTGRVVLVEVKGSYRLHSHARARLAFMECVKKFPMFGFHWTTWGKEKGWWDVEVYENGEHSDTQRVRYVGGKLEFWNDNGIRKLPKRSSGVLIDALAIDGGSAQ